MSLACYSYASVTAIGKVAIVAGRGDVVLVIVFVLMHQLTPEHVVEADSSSSLDEALVFVTDSTQVVAKCNTFCSNLWSRSMLLGDFYDQLAPIVVVFLKEAF